MAHAILSRFVDPRLLEDRQFHYQRAHLKLRGSEDQYHLTKEHQKKKAYHYFQDPATTQWYFGDDNPHPTKRLLGAMALGTLILYVGTLALRVIQTVIILTGVFFRSYKATFAQRKQDDFSEIFFQSVEVQFFQQKEGLFFIGRSLVLDAQCSVAMEVAGVAANFYNDEHQIRKMEVIFSAMEQKWNKGPDFDLESGDELSWHPENSSIANWAFFLKNKGLRGMTYQEVLDKLAEVREQSNRTFYIYQCAQPLSQRFLERLDWINEPPFMDYAALTRHYEAQAQRLDQQRY